MPDPISGAMLASAIIGGGASIFGSMSAANAQSNAASQATAAEMAMFDKAFKQTKEWASPFIDAGKNVLGPLARLTTPGPDQTKALEQTPGYAFNLSQGEKGVTNQATMSGLSGNTLRAGASFASGLASNTWSDVVNKLISQMGIGASTASGASNTLMSNATAVGGQIGNNITGAGNARAGADIAAGNAVGGATGSVSNALMLNALTGGKLFGGTGSPGAWGSGSPVPNSDQRGPLG